MGRDIGRISGGELRQLRCRLATLVMHGRTQQDAVLGEPGDVLPALLRYDGWCTAGLLRPFLALRSDDQVGLLAQ